MGHERAAMDTKAPKHRFPADRISGLVLGAVGIFLLYAARSLPFGKLNAPDSGFFPIILAVLLAGMGFLLFLSSFRSEPETLELDKRSWSVLFGALSLLAYALLLERIGFLICTIAILFVIMRLYGGMTLRTCLLVCVPTVVLAYLGFIELGVPLPRGLL